MEKLPDVNSPEFWELFGEIFGNKPKAIQQQVWYGVYRTVGCRRTGRYSSAVFVCF